MKLDARPSALFVFGLLAALKAAALVGIAQAVATGIVSVIAGTDAWHGALALGIGSGALRAVVTWAVPVFATHAAQGRKESLRHDLAARLHDQRYDRAHDRRFRDRRVQRHVPLHDHRRIEADAGLHGDPLQGLGRRG